MTRGEVGDRCRKKHQTSALEPRGAGLEPEDADKAKGLPTDQVFMDIEDAVAPLKPDARKNIVAALNGGYDGKVRSVRVNDWTTEWTYLDVIEVVSGAGANLDCIMLPKARPGRFAPWTCC